MSTPRKRAKNARNNIRKKFPLNGQRCAMCGKKDGDVTLTRHHIGGDPIGNRTKIAILCASCHQLAEEKRALKKALRPPDPNPTP